MTKNNPNLKIKIFADGADKASMLSLSKKSYIKGLTTNPTLMKKAGIKNYQRFAKDVLSVIKTKPVSFEVFSDDFSEMERQAKLIASWGRNAYVKIPVTNTKGKKSLNLIKKLSSAGVKLNVTAVFTLRQVREIVEALDSKTPSVISIFAGRIADTGRDPIPLMKKAKKIINKKSIIELLWASPRELINLKQAADCGCDIITVQPQILEKLKLLNKNLDEFSLDTVKMFYEDAKTAGYTL